MNWSEFAVIALAHLFAVASPGPDFAVVLRQTLSHGTRAGIWTSAGIASGIGLHVTYCLLGVALVIVNTRSRFEPDCMRFFLVRAIIRSRLVAGLRARQIGVLRGST